MRNFFRTVFKYQEGGIGYATMLKMLVWTTILTSLSFGRVHLLFSVKDYHIEARQLQERAGRC